MNTTIKEWNKIKRLDKYTKQAMCDLEDNWSIEKKRYVGLWLNNDEMCEYLKNCTDMFVRDMQNWKQEFIKEHTKKEWANKVKIAIDIFQDRKKEIILRNNEILLFNK